jgi:amidase
MSPGVTCSRLPQRWAYRLPRVMGAAPLERARLAATARARQPVAGSLALAGSRAERDATVAARLREAGAVLIGKANMSEWANFRSTASTSGWSARGGQCRNPYALDRSPSGSSSGSAVATAANLVAAAIGTETDGSIVSPASHCALVGVKPSSDS